MAISNSIKFLPVKTLPLPPETNLDWISSAVIGEANVTFGFSSEAPLTSTDSIWLPPAAGSQAVGTAGLQLVRVSDSNSAGTAKTIFFKINNFQGQMD
jgi:hypothetical protein